MTLSKKSRTLVIIGIIITVLGGTGTFGGLYYRAVNQIEVDVEHIYITNYSIGGTLLNPTMDVSLEINALISNPTNIAVEVEYAQFEIYLDGLYSGDGQTSSFTATKTPSPMKINTFLDDIGGSQYLLLADLILLGNSKVATIRITNVKVMGIIVEINQDINVTITQEDFLF
ncbi:MAG: hypothetical protein K9W44_02155 [Candidatus Lokiarchaeota archaeon]|nr:hypothetical protein [Candidatus Harpocratesius repetitus]